MQTITFLCPHCGKEIQIQIDETGTITASLFHKIEEATHEQVASMGVELAISTEKGGEVGNG